MFGQWDKRKSPRSHRSIERQTVSRLDWIDPNCRAAAYLNKAMQRSGGGEVSDNAESNPAAR
jgi:hypothetical protein